MNLPSNIINDALSKLIPWLEQWRSENGAYNGFVFHRFERKRMKYLHDTAWTQAAVIRGYCNLYRKSPEARWYDLLIHAADLQASRFEADSGKYLYAGHEDDRFCSLIHCALANCALLDAYDLVDEMRQNKYLQVVKGNIDRYWLGSLWVKNEGAFRFSDVDYYSQSEDRFVINCNCVAAECLLRLSQLINDNKYSRYAVIFGQWLIDRCSEARIYYEELQQKAEKKDRDVAIITLGGLPYQHTTSHGRPDNCVCLYAGLSLRGIASLADYTGNREYRKIAGETTRFLLSMRDPQTHLFYHTTEKNHIVHYPQFISGAGMALVGVDQAKNLLDDTPDVTKTVESILKLTYANGSCPSFLGKNSGPGRNKKGKVWEDVVASVNWNAQWFEYLTRIVEDPERISINVNTETVRISTERFIYSDLPKNVSIVSWWPWKSMGVFFIKKAGDKATFTFDLPNLLRIIYHSLKRAVSKFQNKGNNQLNGPKT